MCFPNILVKKQMDIWQMTRWKPATLEQLTGAHLYLDIAKSGYLFHAVGNVMVTEPSRMKSVRTEGCHVGHFREFVGTACCTYGQLNTTIESAG